ncbi:hypothetical protein SAY87_016438 [Trapa incisa]|uniref:Coatomer subunit zeta n=1 Tax=Trapa incisa TaxID=236973 RepID=A0AAN7QVE1_9MYRT|nr:hypothetical protein SAY87_016438 [Trapa incisa]
MAYFSASRDSCPSVKNILLLDSEGKRIAVKYYSDDWPTNSSKLAFEKSVFTKTLKTNARTEAEIAMFENNIVIYKFVQDLHFFLTGGDDENELILAAVLQGFFDAVALLLRNNVDKREALENLDLILLSLDEIVDGGMILETDASSIAAKVAAHTAADSGAPLSEQVMNLLPLVYIIFPGLIIKKMHKIFSFFFILVQPFSVDQSVSNFQFCVSFIFIRLNSSINLTCLIG